MNKEENSIIQCKHCNQTKIRYSAGLYPNGKDRKWVNEKGKQFTGLVCPECLVEKARQRKRLQALAK